MLFSKRLLVLLTILVFATSFSAGPAFQGGQDRRFFPETGHWVEGEFLTFYNNTPNAARLLGYPLTDAYEHPQLPGLTIQHFQRARLELHPENVAGQQVEIAPLGNYMFDVNAAEPAGIAVNNAACRQFPVSKLSVCYAFLQFYDANNGADYFGEPVSDLVKVDGLLVQYFEKARMEWHPENPNGQHVILTDLGRLDFDQINGDTSLTGRSGNAPLVSPLTIKVHAFPERPLLAPDQQQTLYIVVLDQNAQPVENAQVSITLLLPSGQRQNVAPNGPTSADGFTTAVFPVDGLLPTDVVEVQVTATLLNGGPKNATVTHFRAWW